MLNKFVAILRNLYLFCVVRKSDYYKVWGFFQMKIDPSDFADRGFLFGYYERDLILLIKRVVTEGDICIDIGSQKGYISLHLGKKVKKNGLVLAFEPDPRAYAQLVDNCTLNKFEMIKCFPYAVGDRNEETLFRITNQIGFSTFFPNEIAKEQIVDIIKVKQVRLDDFLKKYSKVFGKITFIKIDAEGSEPNILRGIREILLSENPIIWIEINPASLSEAKESATNVYDYLMNLGFQLYSPHLERRFLLFHKLFFTRVVDMEKSPSECQNVLAVSCKSVYYEKIQAMLLI